MDISMTTPERIDISKGSKLILGPMKSMREVLRGNLLIFILGDVMRQLSMFITFPFFSLYIQSLGGSVVDVGLVNSLRPVAAFFIYPIAGYIADRYSRAKIITISGYVSAILYLIFAFAPDWKALAIGNFLNGLMVFTFPAMNSLMAESIPPDKRGVGYSVWIAIPSAIGILSPYIGGYLITILGVVNAMRVLYGLTVIMNVLISTMNIIFLHEPRGKESYGKGFLNILLDSYRDMFRVLRGLPHSLKAFSLMLILSFLMNNVAAPFWVIYVIRQIGLLELQWGEVLLIAALINAVLLIPAGIAVDRFNLKKLLSLSLFLAAASIFLFPFSRGFSDIILLFIAITAANTFLISGAPALMAHTVPSDKRGRIMAALGQGMLSINTRGGSGGPGMGAILTIPSILGSIMGGFIYSYNPIIPWFLLASSLLFNSVIAIKFISN
jgi:MFS family permease